MSTWLLPHEEFVAAYVFTDVLVIDNQHNEVDERHKAENSEKGKEIPNNQHRSAAQIDTVNGNTAQKERQYHSNPRIFVCHDGRSAQRSCKERCSRYIKSDSSSGAEHLLYDVIVNTIVGGVCLQASYQQETGNDKQDFFHNAKLILNEVLQCITKNQTIDEQAT